MKLTSQIKVETSSEEHADLLETMRVFNLACQFISDYAFENRVFNKRTLQGRIYYDLRERFCLPAQLTIRAFGKVGDAYRTSHTQLRKRIKKYHALSKEKRAKRKPPELKMCQFNNTGAVVYDRLLLRYETADTVSIRAFRSRLSLRVVYPPRFDAATIKGEADLVLVDNTFYLLQTVAVEELPLIDVDDFVGVDLGMVHIAYDSDGIPYDDPGIEAKRKKYETRRSNLKKKKTNNSRRALKKMSKKLARFRKDVNHCISKRLVRKAKVLKVGLAMESLVNFFDPAKTRRKNRASRHSWAFFQLRSFVAYKALQEGIPLVLIDPAYSSQECSECHCIDKRNRPSQSKFRCVCCGHTDNADFNSAKVLKFRACVNRLELSACAEGEEATTQTFGFASALEAAPLMRLPQAARL